MPLSSSFHSGEAVRTCTVLAAVKYRSNKSSISSDGVGSRARTRVEWVPRRKGKRLEGRYKTAEAPLRSIGASGERRGGVLRSLHGGVESLFLGRKLESRLRRTAMVAHFLEHDVRPPQRLRNLFLKVPILENYV